MKFNHILKTRVKDGVDMLELEFQIIDKSLAGCAEFDILYLILERGFVQQVIIKPSDRIAQSERRYCPYLKYS